MTGDPFDLKSFLAHGKKLCNLTESCDAALERLIVAFYAVTLFSIIVTMFSAGSIAFLILNPQINICVFSLTFFLQV